MPFDRPTRWMGLTGVRQTTAPSAPFVKSTFRSWSCPWERTTSSVTVKLFLRTGRWPIRISSWLKAQLTEGQVAHHVQRLPTSTTRTRVKIFTITSPRGRTPGSNFGCPVRSFCPAVPYSFLGDICRNEYSFLFFHSRRFVVLRGPRCLKRFSRSQLLSFVALRRIVEQRISD